MGYSLNVKVCNVSVIIAKVCNIVLGFSSWGGHDTQDHSMINIIIQVDFTASSGMLQMRTVTLMYILGYRLINLAF